jgi:hypothetical protein
MKELKGKFDMWGKAEVEIIGKLPIPKLNEEETKLLFRAIMETHWRYELFTSEEDRKYAKDLTDIIHKLAEED